MKDVPARTPEAHAAWAQFIADLREAHINAGKPTYRKIEQRSCDELKTWKLRHAAGQQRPDPKTEIVKPVHLTKTTLSRVLNGFVEPKWNFVFTFLRSCNIRTETVMEVWHPKWTNLAGLLHPYTAQGPAIAAPAAPPPGITCPRCGSWVTDEELHKKWHTDLDVALRLRKTGAPRTAWQHSPLRSVPNESPAAGRLAG
jgi:hypothetical protein